MRQRGEGGRKSGPKWAVRSESKSGEERGHPMLSWLCLETLSSCRQQKPPLTVALSHRVEKESRGVGSRVSARPSWLLDFPVFPSLQLAQLPFPLVVSKWRVKGYWSWSIRPNNLREWSIGIKSCSSHLSPSPHGQQMPLWKKVQQNNYKKLYFGSGLGVALFSLCGRMALWWWELGSTPHMVATSESRALGSKAPGSKYFLQNSPPVSDPPQATRLIISKTP